MKYVCLVYSEEEKLKTLTDDECMIYDKHLRDSGLCIASEALESIQTATTVRVRNGKVNITDGPFAETREILAGFYLIEARDLDHAIELAAEIPPATVGSIEIRPVRQLINTSGEQRNI